MNDAERIYMIVTAIAFLCLIFSTVWFIALLES